MPKEVTEKDFYEFLIHEKGDCNALYEYVSNCIEISLDLSTKEKVRNVHRKFYRRVENEFTKKKLSLIQSFCSWKLVIMWLPVAQTMTWQFLRKVLSIFNFAQSACCIVVPPLFGMLENLTHYLLSNNTNILCTNFQHAMPIFKEIIEDFQCCPNGMLLSSAGIFWHAGKLNSFSFIIW